MISHRPSFVWPEKSGPWLVYQELEAWYRTRTVPYDHHLVIQADSFGQAHLQNHGIEYQPQRTAEDRAILLPHYQHEMQTFATFLKTTYLLRNTTP